MNNIATSGIQSSMTQGTARFQGQEEKYIPLEKDEGVGGTLSKKNEREWLLPSLIRLSMPVRISDEPNKASVDDRIHQMEQFNIFNYQQVQKLMNNIQAPPNSSDKDKEEYYWHALKDLARLVFLAAAEREQGQPFGPSEVTPFITDKDHSTALQSDRIPEFIIRSSSGPIKYDSEKIQFLASQYGQAILERFSNDEDYRPRLQSVMKELGYNSLSLNDQQKKTGTSSDQDKALVSLPIENLSGQERTSQPNKASVNDFFKKFF